MKCDDFITSHETGSALSRLRARFHARRCPKCAATQEWLSQLRSQLATSGEITSFHRRLWEQVAVEEAPKPVWRWHANPRLAVAGGLAIAAVLVVMLTLSLPKKEEIRAPNVAGNSHSPSAPTVVTMPLGVPPDEIAELEFGLNQVAADLDRLAEEAARLEARRAISELAAKHQPLGPGDST